MSAAPDRVAGDIRPAPVRLIAGLIAAMERIPYWLIAIMARVPIAGAFWQSGETKVDGWHVVGLSRGPAPQADPKFKWIAVDAGAIRHPDWTAEQHAQSIKHDIDQALDRGYRVVVSDVWSWSPDELAGQLGGLSAADRATAIYSMLHANYEAQPTFSDPVAGTYYELHRRPGR